MSYYNPHSGGFVWWTERNKIAVAKSTDGSIFTSPGAGNTVRIFAIKQANHFSTAADINLSAESEIPDEFHDAILSRVLMMAAERSAETFTEAHYWKVRYDEYIREGKKYANSRRIATTAYPIKAYEY